MFVKLSCTVHNYLLTVRNKKEYHYFGREHRAIVRLQRENTGQLLGCKLCNPLQFY
jgi:hypothetical protein